MIFNFDRTKSWQPVRFYFIDCPVQKVRAFVGLALDLYLGLGERVSLGGLAGGAWWSWWTWWAWWAWWAWWGFWALWAF